MEMDETWLTWKSYVLPDEVRLEILLVPNDKCYGLYSAPTKLLKCSSAVIALVFSEILDTSIRLGTLKSDDHTDENNNRPI